MPQYQRCGDIVWICKKRTRTFAFQCIFCQDSRTTTFKDFKLHLERQHSALFQGEENEDIKPVLENEILDNRDQEAVPTAKEEDPLASQVEEQIKMEEFLSEDDAQEFQGDHEEDTLLECLESDCDSIESLQASKEVQTPPTITDLSPFWLLEHPIMLAFIAQLEQQPLLWDLGMEGYRNYRQRSKAYEKIAGGLLDQFGLKLTEQDIASYTNQLKYVYNKEKLRLEQITDPPATPTWYYQRLHFLVKSLGGQGQPLGLHHAQNLKLIELYRQCRANWDMQDMSCRLNQVRRAAKDRLLELCRSELHIPLDPSQLQAFVRRLRSTYRQEKARQLKSECEGKEFCSRSRYYEKLKFLEQHMAPFRCDLCHKLINSVDLYKIHRAKHDGSHPFVCPTCGKGFYKVGDCTNHFRRHNPDYHLSCEECGRLFANTADVTNHRRTHTGERPYCCHICGRRFLASTCLKRHKLRHEQRRVAKCHICDKGFYTRSELRDHINAHLNVRNKECDVCHKRFTSARYLRRHKEIHAEHKRYLCKTCGRRFAQDKSRKAHMKTCRVLIKITKEEEEVPQ
ncbi:zinc finger protein 492-like [Drosophila rhopaloa]|uniref:Zinc finger protein 492-like n=1 Tax=Drosophila rhopaloa TaxID=1041015 RepID=A0A6P4FHR9_DRORH|nr:zinc finger protein 492-like [Drosophila rhopaloa]